MTIGIYSLIWDNSDKVYIGQSVNIEKRFISHKSKFNKQKHSSYLQNMFNKYGMPKLRVVEQCPISELDNKEKYWISVTMNVNISEGGSNGLNGVNSPKCGYTKPQILIVAKMLCNPVFTNDSISISTGVSKWTIESIRKKKRHSWLSEEYPEIWSKISSIKRYSISQERRFESHAIVEDCKGNKYEVFNIASFCRQHNLNKGHMCAMIRGEINIHKGFKLIENLKGGSDE